jgi:hypothetical protein
MLRSICNAHILHCIGTNSNEEERRDIVNMGNKEGQYKKITKRCSLPSVPVNYNVKPELSRPIELDILLSKIEADGGIRGRWDEVCI